MGLGEVTLFVTVGRGGGGGYLKVMPVHRVLSRSARAPWRGRGGLEGTGTPGDGANLF